MPTKENSNNKQQPYNPNNGEYESYNQFNQLASFGYTRNEIARMTPEERQRKIDKINANPKPKNSNFMKGIIFETEKEITDNEFEDLIEEGIYKIGEKTYIYFKGGNSSETFTTHDQLIQDIQNKYGAKEIEGFTSTETPDGKIHYNDDFVKHNKYSEKIREKTREFYKGQQ